MRRSDETKGAISDISLRTNDGHLRDKSISVDINGANWYLMYVVVKLYKEQLPVKID